jgi:hypothetical protein
MRVRVQRTLLKCIEISAEHFAEVTVLHEAGVSRRLLLPAG